MTDKIPSENDATSAYYVIEEQVETKGAGRLWSEIKDEGEVIRLRKYLDAAELKCELERSNPGEQYRIVLVETKRKTVYPVEHDTELGVVQAAKTELIFVEAQLLARIHPASKPVHAALRELRKAEAAL